MENKVLSQQVLRYAASCITKKREKKVLVDSQFWFVRFLFNTELVNTFRHQKDSKSSLKYVFQVTTVHKGREFSAVSHRRKEHYCLWFKSSKSILLTAVLMESQNCINKTEHFNTRGKLQP